jgi:hypothetical protein
MSVKRIYPKHRLREFIGHRHGKRRSELVAAATTNLNSIRTASLVEVGALVERIQQLGEVLRREADPAKAQEVYDLSNEICGIAGAFGLIHLGKAAYSLCDLLDRLGAAKKWNWPAIQVHLDGIQTLRTHASGSDQEAVRDAVIDGLVKVVAHVDATLVERASMPPDGKK